MTNRKQYIDLLKKALTCSIWDNHYYEIDNIGYTLFNDTELVKELHRLTNQLGQGLKLVLKARITDEEIKEGTNWPAQAHTMIGLKRLNNIQFCVEQVVENGIEGDLVETGVWRGGACILMKGILNSYEDKTRNVWVVDSFCGIPEPNIEKYPQDKNEQMHLADILRVSEEEVKYNFTKYNLLDDRVKFLKGRFCDTLPNAPIEKISVLRLDGDTYEATTDSLSNLYPKLSQNGYLIVDDFHGESCRAAVYDYRKKNDIKEEIIAIDSMGVYWKKLF